MSGSAHNLGKNLYDHGVQRLGQITDPGDAGTIKMEPGRSKASVPLVTSASETRTLADPDGPNLDMLLYMVTDGGNCVITASTALDEAGNTTLTFSDPGQFVDLVSVETADGTFAWRVRASDGVTGPESMPASTVSLADSGGFTSTDNVEAALAEIYQHLLSVNVVVPIALTALREVDSSGDVGDTTANGGVLASNTTPILLGDANECLSIQWAAANQDPVAVSVTLPEDLDDASDVAVDLFVQAAGTDDAPSFTVETSWNGAAKVSDTASGSASTSLQTATATVAAADVPSDSNFVTIGLTPGAHATDAWDLKGIRLRYKGKARTA